MNLEKIIYDLIIIGGGPGGITAGIYASRQKLKTLLITKEFGGQVAKKAGLIENYPGFEKISGLELIEKFRQQLERQDIKIEKDTVLKVEKPTDYFFVSTAGGNTFQSKSLIVASGAGPRLLEVPGEKEFVGKGVSYCTVCDGALFGGKKVAVIGGGNAGIEAALFLTKYASKVYVLEYMKELGADLENQELARKNKKIEIITNVALKEIKGSNFVESLLYQKRDTKEEIILPVEGVFIEIGTQPSTAFVGNLVDFNERGEIKVQCETYQTKTEGLFAVGDCNVGKVKQIVVACGEGAKAALSVYDYLRSLSQK